MYKIVVIFLWLVFVFSVQAQKVNTSFTIQGEAQGTTYLIKYYSDSHVIAKKNIDSLLNIIDLSMSTYRKTSLISQFNDPLCTAIDMDVHMKKVVEASFRTSKSTKGYFDITIFPLLKLWGFGPEGNKFHPSDRKIDSIMQFVGMNKLYKQKSKLVKTQRGVSIDLNGIAQGYSVDVLYDYLKSKGINNFLIELGGEIRSRGHKPDGDFIVEVQRPYDNKDGETHLIKLKNKAITTSATYEKKHLVDGKVVSHHINPFTGRPTTSTVVSVTVVANTAMEADAIDNYFMYLSPQEAIDYAEKQKDIEIYLIYFENNVFKELQSSGFNKYIY